jgi:hypothetical protein
LRIAQEPAWGTPLRYNYPTAALLSMAACSRARFRRMAKRSRQLQAQFVPDAAMHVPTPHAYVSLAHGRHYV